MVLSLLPTLPGASSVVVTVGQGQTGYPYGGGTFYISGLAPSGTANITATVATVPNPGFAVPPPLVVTLTPVGYYISYCQGCAYNYGVPDYNYALTTSVNAAPVNMTAAVYAVAPDGSLAAGGGVSRAGVTLSVPVAVTPASLGTITDGTNPITAATFPANSSSSSAFYYAPKSTSAGGSGTIKVTQPAGAVSVTQSGLSFRQSVAVTETLTPISFYQVSNATLNGAAALVVGKDLQVAAGITLGGPAPAGGLQVKLTSDNPNVLLSSSPTVVGSSSVTLTVPAGGTGYPYGTGGGFYISGLASSGTAHITATIQTLPNPGYSAPSPLVVTLTPAGYYIGYCQGCTYNAGAPDYNYKLSTSVNAAPSYMYASVTAVAPDGTSLVGETTRAGSAITVPLSVAPSTLGGFTDGTNPITAATFPANSASSNPFYYAPNAGGGGGNGTLSLNPPAGSVSPTQAGLAYRQSVAVTESLTSIAFYQVTNATLNGSSVFALGKDLQVASGITLGGPSPAGGLQVKLSSNNPNVLLGATATDPGSTTLTLTIPASSTGYPYGAGGGFFVSGLAPTGTATITATVVTSPNPGFAAPAPLVVTLTPSGYSIGYCQGCGYNYGNPDYNYTLTTSVAASPTYMYGSVNAVASDGTVLLSEPTRAGVTVTVPVSVTPGTLGKMTDGTNPITAMTFTPNSSNSSVFYFAPNPNSSGGNGTIKLTQPVGSIAPTQNGLAYRQSIALSETLTSVYFTTTSAVNVGKDLQYVNYIALGGNAPAGGLQIRLKSSSPNVLLSASPTVVGASTLTFTIAAGSAGGYYDPNATFYIQSTAATGSAQISIELLTATTEFVPATPLNVTLVPSGFTVRCQSIYCPPDPLNGGSDLTTTVAASATTMYVSVTPLDPGTQVPLGGSETIRPGVTVSLPLNLSVAGVGEFLDYTTGTTVLSTLPMATNTTYAYFYFKPLAKGSTTIGFSAPSGSLPPLSGGFPSLQTISVVVN